MPLDVSGATLGAAIAAALGEPTPPVNPSPAQQAAYLAAKAAQVTNWTIICQQILSYLVTNTVVTTTDTVTLPLSGVATIIAPPSGGPCTGSGSGTGTGTGTIS